MNQKLSKVTSRAKGKRANSNKSQEKIKLRRDDRSVSSVIPLPQNMSLMPCVQMLPRRSSHLRMYRQLPPPIYRPVVPYYPQFSNRNYRFPNTDWNSVTSIHYPAIHQIPPPFLCPFVDNLVPYTSTRLLTNGVPIYSSDPRTLGHYGSCVCVDQTVPSANSSQVSFIEELSTSEAYNTQESIEVERDETIQEDPLEFYLTLPKNLFPRATMLPIDPNPIIDEFCKISDLNVHSSWILDLEYGVPRVPVTRPIAIYDVQLSMVQCKNTPEAIHPGFEACSAEFKSALTYYYDCVISSWYTGYLAMNYDRSVAQFQKWLKPPMETFGMCWP